MHGRGRTWIAAIAALLLAAFLARSGTPERRPHDAEGPMTWSSPVDERATFTLADPALRIDLVACEPRVVAPVFLTFDGDGRLWIVEMRSYMRGPDARGEEAPTGRIVTLEDRDDDGGYETARTFLDGLVLPRALLPCFGGALVLEPPNLLFCRDEDGDGRADTRRVLLSGLSGSNPEHAPNALTWGLDNWVHLSQSGIELRFDGGRIETRPTPAHGQWGMTQDEWGRLYTTPNSEALRADLVPKHYASRNPGLARHAGINELACRDQSVHPAVPTGVNRGYQDGILRADGRLAVHTAACSPLRLAGDAMGDGYAGDFLVCEPAGLLVRRLRVEDVAGVVSARPALAGVELLTSTDERFRPVSLAISPRGEVFIADMYRGIIQHKTYLTPYLKEQIRARGLEVPLEAGRIWRLRREGATSRRPGLPEGDSGLAGMLQDPVLGGLAQQRLVERRATAARGAIIEAAGSGSAEARVRALWTLEGIGALSREDAIHAIEDPHPRVRIAGVRLLEAWIGEPATRGRVEGMLADPDRFVRIQAAHSLGEAIHAIDSLAVAARRLASDSIGRHAIISGLAGREVEMIERLMVDASWPADGGASAMLAELADTAIRTPRGASALLAFVLARREDPRAPRIAERFAAAARLGTDSPRTIALAGDPPALDGEDLVSRRLAEVGPQFRPPRSVGRTRSPGERALFERGAALYQQACALCHGVEGAGIPGQIPPLAGSEHVTGPEARLAAILMHGLEGPLTVAGQRFEGVMPPSPWRADDEIAAIATYIRGSWGNEAAGVPPERIRTTRAMLGRRGRPWRAEELAGIE